jgi:hypothetical protein
MRFSHIIVTKPLAAQPIGEALGETSDLAPLTIAGTAPPWPADSPPDDLDQRVRQVGEWQLGDW